MSPPEIWFRPVPGKVVTSVLHKPHDHHTVTCSKGALTNLSFCNTIDKLKVKKTWLKNCYSVRMLCINWAEICKDKINLNYNLIGSSWNDNFCCLLANIVYENLCVHGKCAIFVLTFLCLFCYLDMLIEIIKKKDRCIRLFRLKNHTFESISRENL